MWLLLAFVAVPLIEIGLFIQIGGWLTLWPTLAIVLATGIIGTILVKQQGLKVLGELRNSMSQMRDPLSPLAHGALILFAGALLLTPGFFTDTVGFLLLVPAIRQAIIRVMASRVTVASFGTSQGFDSGSGFRAGPGPRRPDPYEDAIEVDYDDVTQSSPSREAGNKRPSGWTEH